MNIDVTSLFYSDTWALSGSQATHGANAGPSTWQASVAEAVERPILSTPKELDALRDHVRAMGLSANKDDDGNEVERDATECNALLVQMVSLDKREMGLDEAEQGEDADLWASIADDMAEGCIPSNMFRTEDGRVFYYLGN